VLDVERPPKESASPVRMMGHVAVRLVSSLMSNPEMSAVPSPAISVAPKHPVQVTSVTVTTPAAEMAKWLVSKSVMKSEPILIAVVEA
jgi:hypothetical protein